MKKIILGMILGLIVVSLLIFNFDSSKINEENKIKENNLKNEELMMEDKKDKSSYVEFTKEAYDQAIIENKKILLYFYASWCPTCRAEQPAVNGAFEEIENSEIVGFRVNYKDSDTDQFEEDLAKEFGIAYQHTKVLIVNGEQVLKSLESWTKERYIEELNNL